MYKEKIVVLFITLLCLAGCAKFVPPTGGEKDIIPPKLIASIPANKTKNYTEPIIKLTFDELVDTKTLKQDLIITPEPKGKYKIKNKGEVVELLFEEKLDSNTTYTFNFGAGIKDLNEQNKSQNLKLVFSTGNILDSMSVKGNIKSLFTKENLLNMTVGLFSTSKKDTLPLLAQKPDYFLKTDSSGNFNLENLKQDNYRLITFKDENNNLRFDNKKELFGFIGDTLNLNKNLEGLEISAYPYDTIGPKYKRYVQKETDYTLRFDEDLYKVNVLFLQKGDSLAYQFKGEDLVFYNTLITNDSVMVKLEVTDSLLNSDTLTHKIQFKPKTEVVKNKKNNEPETIKTTVTPENENSIKAKQPIDIIFDYPISLLDTSKIEVKDDTLTTLAYKAVFENKSKTKLRITVSDKIKSKLVISIEKGAFIDIRNDTNKLVELEYSLLKNNELGIIAGGLTNIDTTAAYIFQLLVAESQKQIEEQISEKGTFNFENLTPNSYQIRVIEDANKNGIWDTGDFQENKQAENVILLKEPIKLKANFEFRDLKIPNK